MTEETKKEITKLRLDGVGYKGIAATLGISRDGVRSFCKRNGLYGDSCVVSLNYEENKNQNKICTHCGIPLKQKLQGRVRRFCSDECRRKWWRENSQNANRKDTAMYRITCAYCGKEFESYGDKKRKYDTHDCYIKSRFYKEECINAR